jgi:hypothetical protein
MIVDTVQLEILKIRAKETFALAVSYGANRQEGLSILMENGLVLSGYSQMAPDMNSAKDALRGPLNDASDPYSKGKIKDNFKVAAIVVVTKNQKTNPHKATLRTLSEFVGICDGQTVHVVAADTGTTREIKLVSS